MGVQFAETIWTSRRRVEYMPARTLRDRSGLPRATQSRTPNFYVSKQNGANKNANQRNTMHASRASIQIPKDHRAPLLKPNKSKLVFTTCKTKRHQERQKSTTDNDDMAHQKQNHVWLINMLLILNNPLV